jgi:hypothetical protein
VIAAADREALAQKVASAFQAAFSKLIEHKTDIERLWQEFESLKVGEVIMGCRTKSEFCENVLHRSMRAVQYLVYGREQCSHLRIRRDNTLSAPLILSRKQKERLLNAATIVGTELLPAFEHGHDISEPLKELKTIAFDSQELNSILDPYNASFSEPKPELVCSLNEEILSESRALAKAVLRQHDYSELLPLAARVISLTDETTVGKNDTDAPADCAILEDEQLYAAA